MANTGWSKWLSPIVTIIVLVAGWIAAFATVRNTQSFQDRDISEIKAELKMVRKDLETFRVDIALIKQAVGADRLVSSAGTTSSLGAVK